MKKKWSGRIFPTVLSLALLCSLGGAIDLSEARSVSAAASISVSPYSAAEINGGEFQGWGTSLCWWANRVGYSDSLSKQAAELFFSESGLGMNIARFNIGGGDDPSHDHITRTDSNMPGYTVYNNGNVTYNWNADANQRNVLFKAKDACERGLIVEMFSNSPPYYMTKSGCSTGGTNPGANNLKDDCYDDFAEYLAEVCKHYETEWGIDVQSVTPLNEPYTNYWGAYSAKQEGCHFDIGASESNIILELQKSLRKRGLNDILLSGTDETSIDTQISAYNALSAEAKAAISRIDTHTYSGSKRSELRQLALDAGKNLWMSEVDGNGVAGTNAGHMSAGLWLSQRIIDDCNGMNPSAWILWQAIDKHICAAGLNGKKDSGMPDISTGFWGLAVADHDKDTIILSKKYYSFGQFSRYIKPGFTLLGSSNSSLAAYDKKNKQLVIVAINTSGSDSDTNFDLSQFSSIGSEAKVVRTSGKDMNSGENWAELAPIATNGSGFNAKLLANSVTTFIIDDVKTIEFDYDEIKVTPDMVTGSAPWNNSANDCKKVVDGSVSTFFDGVGNGWVQIDLGKEYSLDAIAYAPRAGHEVRCVDAVISGSLDGVNWEIIYTVSSTPSSGLNYITKLGGSSTVRYVKYQVPDGKPNNGVNTDDVYCCNIAELKLYGGEPSELAGDINLDGKLDGADILALKKHIHNTLTLGSDEATFADLNASGNADICDLAILKRKILA